MGNYFSSQNRNTPNEGEIEELKHRLANLENLDKNKDGVVSKDELELWMQQQKDDIIKLKDSIEYQLQSKYQTRIGELEKQVNTLENMNHKLRKDLHHVKNHKSKESSGITEASKIKISELSKDRIDAFVEDLLTDENVNVKYLPDFVEKQLYRNIFNMLIGILDNVMETTNVQFMGHQLKFDIVPKAEPNIIETDNSTNSDYSSHKKRRKHKHKHKKEDNDI